MDRAYEQKLFHSCRILFGSRVSVGWDFLFYLKLSGLKCAYRKRALVTHPDRTAHSGGEEGGTESFIAAKEAYNQLVDFIERRHSLRPPRRAKSAPRSPARPSPGRRSRHRPRAGHYHDGSLPDRSLLFGEFLFYSRRISWETLIKAIVWQRRQRPRLGDIACRWGWLSSDQALEVARRKKFGTPMGEALVQYGHLSSLQVKFLIRRQRSMQNALGEYFFARGILSRETLEDLAVRNRQHNHAFTPSPY